MEIRLTQNPLIKPGFEPELVPTRIGPCCKDRVIGPGAGYRKVDTNSEGGKLRVAISRNQSGCWKKKSEGRYQLK